MSIPLPPDDLTILCNTVLTQFGSDKRGTVEYRINNMGYRNNIDYVENDSNFGLFVGSSLTSGMGIPWDSAFPFLTAKNTDTKCYHLSQGCTEVDNQEILRILTDALNSMDPEYVVVQFINLNRRYDPVTGTTTYEDDQEKNVELFTQTFKNVAAILQGRKWVFFGCDADVHDVPDSIKHHNNCVSWNPPALDQAGLGCHLGRKWHYMMSLGLTKKLSQYTT